VSPLLCLSPHSVRMGSTIPSRFAFVGCRSVGFFTCLDLGPLVPVRILGDELSPSGMVTGNTPRFIMSVTATNTHFFHIFSKCSPPYPLWPALSSTSSLWSPVYYWHVVVLHLSYGPSMTLPLCHPDIFCWLSPEKNGGAWHPHFSDPFSNPIYLNPIHFQGVAPTFVPHQS